MAAEAVEKVNLKKIPLNSISSIIILQDCIDDIC